MRTSKVSTIRLVSRVAAAMLAMSLLGGGVAFAGVDGDSGTKDEDAAAAPEMKVDKPDVPDELIAAFTGYRDAISDWRRCIIDMVMGDAEADTCGGAPSADDYGLSADDILAFDLDERLAERVDRKLTRIEIRTGCMEAHAAEGRQAVYECVFAELEARYGDIGHRVKDRIECRRNFQAPTDTMPVAEDDKDASENDCEGRDDRSVRERRGGNDAEGTGDRRGNKDS